MKKCPVCSGRDNNQIEARKGFYFYSIHKCRLCDVVFADPMQTQESFYSESADYLFRDKVILDPIKWDFRWDMLKFLKDPPVGKGNLLDVGCGTGYFVKRALDMGLGAYGLEFNERSVKAGREHFGLDTLYAMDIEGFRQRFPALKFDVVTLFQVLEHLEDPNRMAAAIKGIMNEGAVLVIALPLRGRWPDLAGEGDYPPHHLTRWSPEALRYFLEKNGFRIRRQAIENFPLSNMSGFFYKHVLKLAPFLTMRGRKMEDRVADISPEQALEILKKRKARMAVANILGIPLWIVFKLMGARGPHLYMEAVVDEKDIPENPCHPAKEALNIL